jgi:photosystem II stability/assembly factor-like uncharacterized protein
MRNYIQKMDYVGFTFNGIHSSQFGFKSVTNGNRYQKYLLPGIKNFSEDIDSKNGTYFFGRKFQEKEFNLSIAFDTTTEQEFHEAAAWLDNNGLAAELIFDESPHIKYYARIEKEPQIKFLTFDSDAKTRIYKGEFDISFLAFDPYGYSVHKFLSEYDDDNIGEWSESSNLLFSKKVNNIDYYDTFIPDIDNVTNFTYVKNGNSHLRGLAYGNGVIVNVSSSGELYYSLDNGINWILHSQEMGALSGVDYGDDGYWVIVGEDGQLYYTQDPTSTWIDNAQPSMIYDYGKVKYLHGYWFSMDGLGKLRCTDDPTGTWSIINFDESLILNIGYGNGYWVALDIDLKTRYTTNPLGTWYFNSWAGYMTLYDIYYGDDGYWVIVGEDGQLYYTQDPTGTWTQNSQGTENFWDVDYNKGIWMAVGANGTVYYTKDPTGTWINNNQDVTSIWELTHTDNSFIMSGTNGSFFYSNSIYQGGSIPLYNPGNLSTDFILTLTIDKSLQDEINIILDNNNMTIDTSTLSTNDILVIDNKKRLIKKDTLVKNNLLINGNYFQIPVNITDLTMIISGISNASIEYSYKYL